MPNKATATPVPQDSLPFQIKIAPRHPRIPHQIASSSRRIRRRRWHRAQRGGRRIGRPVMGATLGYKHQRLWAKITVVLTLLVLQDRDKGRRFELPDAPALLGRDSRQIPLTDNTVS